MNNNYGDVIVKLINFINYLILKFYVQLYNVY
jgi:hypothetical protein